MSSEPGGDHGLYDPPGGGDPTPDPLDERSPEFSPDGSRTGSSLGESWAGPSSSQGPTGSTSGQAPMRPDAPEHKYATVAGEGDVETGPGKSSTSPDPGASDDVPILPPEPLDLEDTGIDPEILGDLVLKLAYTMPSITTRRAARDTCLPEPIAADLLAQLKKDRLVEVLGEAGTGYRFAITGGGRDRAARLFEISGYVGPAPVSLASYRELLELQLDQLPEATPEGVRSALADLVLPEEALEVAGLAALSRRTLFLYGPPGNGKTSVGRLIHGAIEGNLWVPYCIGVDSHVIRIFDPQVHEPPETGALPEDAPFDHRWVQIRRPFIVVGGELTVDALDLMFSPSLRFYEAPLHMKANGGTFLLDDFGFQNAEPSQLLGRWIYPLEHRVDHLTLQTGQKLEVPFRQMLIVSTNIDPDKVMDPAFLRRMGYRIYLGSPTPEEYGRIFHEVAGRVGATLPAGIVDRVIQRHVAEGRPLRGCGPRDLIDRARDTCTFRKQPLELTDAVMDVAWRGYYGNLDCQRS
jgi:hypothetical protein